MSEKTISIVNQLEQLDTVVQTIEMLAEEWDLPLSLSMNLNLVLEELVTNIIFYGYDDKDEHLIHITLANESGTIRIRIEDDAREFNPLLQDEPNVDGALEERKIGGLGIFFVRKIMDEVTYERSGNKNILTLTKAL